MRIIPYISLFSGGGVGDTGYRDSGLSPIILNELETDRAQILQANFPDSKVIAGDIINNTSLIEKEAKAILNQIKEEELFMISATPPCQGMSKNGIGSILKAIKDGKRTEIDERNYLFKYALALTEQLKPKFFVWENVDRMFNTYILDDNSDTAPFVDYFKMKLLEMGYYGNFRVHNMTEFGVPQNRRRAIGIFIRGDLIQSDIFDTDNLFPSRTHSSKPDSVYKPYITLKDVIGKLPSLDSVNKEKACSDFHPLHKVPVSRKELYYWIDNTKEGQNAFNNNTCSKCGEISSTQNVYCDYCNVLLPKPTVLKNGEHRLIKGFVSTYKRMKYNEPTPTITTRSAYACSDQNLHPTQNRVLSIYEVALLQGVDPEEFKWGPIKKIKNGKEIIQDIANDTLLRDILGEPVSPIFSRLLGNHLVSLAKELNII